MFAARPVEEQQLKDLAVFCHAFRPFSGARAALVNRSPERVFRGAIGSYGKIKGASAFIAFIGDMKDPNVQEKVGYTGEGIVLEASSCGLGTCWVGGFFRPDTAASLTDMRENEKVLAVTPLGYAEKKVSLEEKIMTGFGRTHKRTPLGALVSGLKADIWPEWVTKALEAARLAPSAVNRQPWRFYISGNGITVAVDNLNDSYSISKRLDCGIAMLHIEAALRCYGVQGEWEFLARPEVARFNTDIVFRNK